MQILNLNVHCVQTDTLRRKSNPNTWPFESKINRFGTLDSVSRTRELLLCQVSSHSDQDCSFYRINIHTHPQPPKHTPTHTHTHTLWQTDRYIRAVVVRRRRGWLISFFKYWQPQPAHCDCLLFCALDLYSYLLTVTAMLIRQWPYYIMSRKQIIRPPFSQCWPIWMECGKYLLLHGILLPVQFDTGQYVGDSRPNENDFVLCNTLNAP